MPADIKDAHTKGPEAGKIHNAEEFSNYVHAVSIPMKLIMAAIVVFFAGLIAYCAFGRVPASIDIAAVVDSEGSCTCYVKASERNDIEPGDRVEVSGQTYEVQTISAAATCIDETLDEYARTVGNLSVGEYAFLVTFDCDLAQGVYSATLVKDYLRPLSVLLSS